MDKRIYIVGTIIVLVVLAFVVGSRANVRLPDTVSFDDARSGTQGGEGVPFEYVFNVDGTLHEAGSMEESASKYWWLDSGGLLNIQNGMGSTIQGGLPSNSKWRNLYASSNPVDTDSGLHPQNIFRLLTRNEWKDFRQQMYFRINADNMSDSPNRNESNGILLLSRFTGDGDLYYAGLRVDGHAVVKKKIDGKYYTLVEEPFLSGEYSRESGKSLLPKNIWIGLRSEIVTIEEGHVKIRLYADIGQTGEWKLVADADDRNSSGEGDVIDRKGYAGVRIDFMDVYFKEYRVDEL